MLILPCGKRSLTLEGFSPVDESNAIAILVNGVTTSIPYATIKLARFMADRADWIAWHIRQN
jgi:hypothetical protein